MNIRGIGRNSSDSNTLFPTEHQPLATVSKFGNRIILMFIVNLITYKGICIEEFYIIEVTKL